MRRKAHPSHAWESPMKAESEVRWSQPAKRNEYNTASARFPQGDNYGQKIITPAAVNKREEEWFTNKSCNLPTRAPRGGVLLLITLHVSSNEARSVAEQCPWHLGWPKISYIVFTFIVHLKFSQERKEAFGPACKRLTPRINYMTCTSITYKCIYTPSPPHRTQEKASIFSTLSACHSEERWEEFLGLYLGCPPRLLFVFNFAGTRFILCIVPKTKILLFLDLLL